jgi:hypothetical protein
VMAREESGSAVGDRLSPLLSGLGHSNACKSCACMLETLAVISFTRRHGIEKYIGCRCTERSFHL